MIRGAWRLGRLAGIDLYLHPTFLLIIGYVALIYWQRTHRVADVLEGILFVLVLFSCVVLHELGHALTARKFGIKTRDIVLLPIGGVARLEKMPEDPKQELLVALAGPAVNLVIASALAVWLLFQNTLQFVGMEIAGGSFAMRVMSANLFLMVFNLIPAFPMDGGRVLRALLALKMDYVSATQTAAFLGQGIAILLGLLGLFVNPFLVLIAFFVWVGAGQEATMVQVKSALSGIPVGRVMMNNFQILRPQDPLIRAIELTLSGFQQDFPVIEEGQLIGVLTQNNMLAALHNSGENTPVEQACDASRAVGGTAHNR
jgi:Zn-dependent protease